MNIVIRTDASLRIGSGHVMRCLTLADELLQRGADVMFVCREHRGHLIDTIEAKGYPVVRLLQAEEEFTASPDDLAHSAWLGVPWRQDATDTIAVVGKSHPQLLIIDHYAVDYRWEQVLRPYVEKIMVIDDLADRLHDCDLLFDQNLYQNMETRYDNLVPDSCTKLLGPRYALLRPEFAVARKNLRQRDGQVKRVLVFFGSADPTNETEKTLQALTSIINRHFEVDVVVGGGNLHKDQIKYLCSKHACFNYYCQVDNMAQLISAADLHVGSAGTTTWERCCLGLPSLTITIAANQVQAAIALAAHGVIVYAGPSDLVSAVQIAEQLINMTKSPNKLKMISLGSMELVDGIGAGRCVNLLTSMLKVDA